MARQAGKESGTGIFHVMMRGINHQSIFVEPEDIGNDGVPVGLYGIQVPLGAWHSVVVHEPSTILEAKDGAYGK